MKRFLGFGEKEGVTLARSMEKIQKGQAVTNLKEYKKGELMGWDWKGLINKLLHNYYNLKIIFSYKQR